MCLQSYLLDFLHQFSMLQLLFELEMQPAAFECPALFYPKLQSQLLPIRQPEALWRMAVSFPGREVTTDVYISIHIWICKQK